MSKIGNSAYFPNNFASGDLKLCNYVELPDISDSNLPVAMIKNN
jgi:hypothetical protein